MHGHTQNFQKAHDKEVVAQNSVYGVETTLEMPRRKINPWKVRPESAAVGVTNKAKAAIGILADELKSVRELPMHCRQRINHMQLHCN